MHLKMCKFFGYIFLSFNFCTSQIKSFKDGTFLMNRTILNRLIENELLTILSPIGGQPSALEIKGWLKLVFNERLHAIL